MKFKVRKTTNMSQIKEMEFVALEDLLRFIKLGDEPIIIFHREQLAPITEEQIFSSEDPQDSWLIEVYDDFRE